MGATNALARSDGTCRRKQGPFRRARQGKINAGQTFHQIAGYCAMHHRRNPAHGSRCIAADGSHLCGGTAADASSGERHPSILPLRLSELLRQCADGRLGCACVPATECSQCIAAMPAGPRSHRRWRYATSKPASLWCRPAAGGCGARHGPTVAGSADRNGASTAHAARTDGRFARRLRTGLSGVLSRRAVRWRTRHWVPSGQWPTAFPAMPIGLAGHEAGAVRTRGRRIIMIVVPALSAS